MLSPQPPPYDRETWRAADFPTRTRLACRAWALQGYGTPLVVPLAYTLKIGLFVAGWLWLCSRDPALGSVAELSTWWARPAALEKAVLWSMLFEVLGLGCGSGPLTGRYLPPVAAPLAWLRPGTIRLPPFPRLPGTAGDARTLVDVALYAGLLGLLSAALLGLDGILPAVLSTLALLGLRDKTVFLAARAEHYATALLLALLAGGFDGPQALPALQWLWVAVWVWAALSKLNRHFPFVVTVMQSNSPLTRWGPLRRWLYRDLPDDARPSPLAHALAHAGTATELLFPVLLVLGDGGPLTLAGLAVMVLFHAYITTSFPAGVPLEWNVTMVYGGLVLFGAHAAAPPLTDPVLIGTLLALCVLPQVAGHLRPERVSFLVSMRYYAGNWPWSIWLFEEGATARLDGAVRKPAQLAPDQLARLYDADTVEAIEARLLAFRHMHLHGRLLHELVPRAVEGAAPLARRRWVEGELVAGAVLGWNFGDGHLHQQQLLAAIQARCGFSPGQLRCIFVESQPTHRQVLSWRIVDAATGELARGEAPVAPLCDRQPWPPPTRTD